VGKGASIHLHKSHTPKSLPGHQTNVRNRPLATRRSRLGLPRRKDKWWPQYRPRERIRNKPLEEVGSFLCEHLPDPSVHAGQQSHAPGNAEIPVGGGAVDGRADEKGSCRKKRRSTHRTEVAITVGADLTTKKMRDIKPTGVSDAKPGTGFLWLGNAPNLQNMEFGNRGLQNFQGVSSARCRGDLLVECSSGHKRSSPRLQGPNLGMRRPRTGR